MDSGLDASHRPGMTASDLPDGLFCKLCVKPHFEKYFRFTESQITLY
jgi:hypothetical protein